MDQDRQSPHRQRSFIHFPRTLLASAVFLAAVAAALFMWFGHFDETDRAEYEKLVGGDDQIGKEGGSKTSKQHRSHLHKHLYFGSDFPRREMVLDSLSAELALEKSGRKIAIVENMHGIEGWVQERLFFVPATGPDGSGHQGRPMQDILQLIAEDGVYHYIDETLSAEDVRLYRFTVDGHDFEPLTFQADKGRLVESSAAMSLVADHADYGDKLLVLIGAVSGKHVLGTFQADKVVIEKSSDGGASALKQMKLEGVVEVKIEGKGVLTASEAEIDLDNFSGIFKKAASGPQAKYVGDMHQGVDKTAPLMVTADTIEGRVTKGNEDNGKKSRLAADSFAADGSVGIVYDADFTAAGDHADFFIDKTTGKLEGEIVLTGDGAPRRCSVTDSNGNVIHADRIAIDTATRTSRFQQPEGHFKALGEASGDIVFSSDTMLWDDRILTLILSGHVNVVQEGIGTLESDKELTALLHKADGKTALKTLEAQGNSTLTFIDPEKSLGHTIKSYGRIKVDHLKGESQLHSPKDAEGNVVEGQQVFFQDEKGEISADRVFIKYGMADNKITPSRVVMEGNVKIINRLAKSKEDDTFTQQYILADRVDFLPESKEMIFKAEKGKRVLLYDKNNNIEVSAPSLKLVRDHAASKETLQGIGGVRLNFVEGELDQLRRHFVLDKLIQKKDKS